MLNDNSVVAPIAEAGIQRFGGRKKESRSRMDADVASNSQTGTEVPFEDDETLLEEALMEEAEADDGESDRTFEGTSISSNTPPH